METKNIQVTKKGQRRRRYAHILPLSGCCGDNERSGGAGPAVTAIGYPGGASKQQRMRKPAAAGSLQLTGQPSTTPGGSSTSNSQELALPATEAVSKQFEASLNKVRAGRGVRDSCAPLAIQQRRIWGPPWPGQGGSSCNHPGSSGGVGSTSMRQPDAAPTVHSSLSTDPCLHRAGCGH